MTLGVLRAIIRRLRGTPASVPTPAWRDKDYVVPPPRLRPRGRICLTQSGVNRVRKAPRGHEVRDDRATRESLD